MASIPLRQFLQGIRELLAQGDIQSALERLQGYLLETGAPAPLRNEAILQLSRYNHLLNEERMGTISPQDARVEQLKLKKAVLDFLDIIPGKLAIKVPLTDAQQELAWDTAAVRQLLTKALSDEELDRVCYDHFRPVYEDFSKEMGKGKKVHCLVEYCERHGELNRLVDLVREHNPYQYDRFAPSLHKER